MQRIALVAIVGMVLGCSTMGPIATDQEQLVLSAGDLGAVGCAGLLSGGKPQDVAMAKVATAAAQAILSSEAPTLDGLKAALEAANLPPQYRGVAAVALQRIAARLSNTGDPIPKDHVAFKMAEAFVTSCGAVLGTAGEVARVKPDVMLALSTDGPWYDGCNWCNETGCTTMWCGDLSRWAQ